MSEPVPSSFDYHTLDADTRQFVQQKANETHGLLKRTAEHILQIGQNLRAVKEKLPHGQFLPWVAAEFEMSRWTAQHFIRVADKLADKWGNFHHLPISVLYELATPSTSEDILTQIQNGQIPPTLEAVKEAKEAERLARAAEQQARNEVEHVQQQLSTISMQMQEKQTTIELLGQEIALLQKQLAAQESRTVEMKEVEKQVITPEAKQQVADLQQRLQEVTRQRDALTRRVDQLAEDARAAEQKHSEGASERRIRLNWYQMTAEFQSGVTKMLSRWPSSLDTQAFEAGDWRRLSQTRELARRVQDECNALTQKRIVESTPLSEREEENQTR